MNKESGAICAQSPKTMSAIEQEVENIQIQLQRIEKSISICSDNFRRFDIPANKLNPDDYYKNTPQCEDGNSAMNKATSEPSPYVKSGIIYKLSELSAYAKQIEQQLSNFNEGAIVPTGMFFERNI